MKFTRQATALAAALMAAGVQAASQCGTNALVGASGANQAAKSCICPSWQADDGATGTCGPIKTSTGQALTIAACPPNSADAATQSNNVDLALMGVTAAMDGTTSNVYLNVTMPAMNGRYFTSVGFTGIGDPDVTEACKAQNMFTDFKASGNNQDKCVDKWAITADFFKLVQCGMNYNAAATTAEYQAYDVNFKVKYNESVSIGADSFYSQGSTRSVVADYPVRIFLKRTFSAALDTNTKVYTQYKVEFAILSQNIPKVNITTSAAAAQLNTAQMYFGYTIQYPYAVKSLDSVIRGTPTAPESSPFDVKINGGAPTPINMTGPNHCSTTLQAGQTVPDYAALAQGAANGAASTCTKAGNWLEFSGLGASTSACTFGTGATGNPYSYSVYFSVDCGTGIAPIDCPLGLNYNPGSNQQTQSNFVTFAIRSENFCIGQNTQNINNVISITNFTAVNVNDYTTPQNGWRYGDRMFLRMDMQGLPLVGCKLVGLRRKWSAADLTAEDLSAINANTTDAAYWTSSDLGVSAASFLDDRSGTIPNVLGNTAALQPGGALAGKSLGLQLPAGNSYWFTVLLAKDFMGFDSTDTANMIKRGEQRFLKMYATIQVTYPSVAPGRRRRRQAAGTAQGEGSIGSTQQTLQAPEEVAAVAPNSNAGARAAVTPMAALALAVLSVVALW